MIHNPPTSQTDRRTDRQTTCDRKTAFCSVVHRAVKIDTLAFKSEAYTLPASGPPAAIAGLYWGLSNAIICLFICEHIFVRRATARRPVDFRVDFRVISVILFYFTLCWTFQKSNTNARTICNQNYSSRNVLKRTRTVHTDCERRTLIWSKPASINRERGCVANWLYIVLHSREGAFRYPGVHGGGREGRGGPGHRIWFCVVLKEAMSHYIIKSEWVCDSLHIYNKENTKK